MSKVIKGTYNKAVILTDNYDQKTAEQVQELVNAFPSIDSDIKIMPDCHAGKGCVIGTTMTIGEYVVPNLVGVDIGCGVMAVRMKDISRNDIDFNALDKFIRENIPSGFSVHQGSGHKYKFKGLSQNFKTDDNYCEQYYRQSLGTLGGGNHFIELDVDEEGYVWLLVHTGSRRLGKDICEHWQKVAERRTDILYSGDGANKKLLLRKIFYASRDILQPPKELSFLDGSPTILYLQDMRFAQDYAEYNRAMIVEEIARKFFNSKDIWNIDTQHNYISNEINDCVGMNILRKGAVSAQRYEMFVIPYNMRDGAIVCEGKGNKGWNYSAPHGCGRTLARGEAKRNLDVEEYKKQMNGVWSSCVNENTLDESPMAYKDCKQVEQDISSVAEIKHRLKPIYNFKAE